MDKKTGLVIVASFLILALGVLVQSRIIKNLRSELKEAQYLQGGDIQKAQTIDSLQRVVDSLEAEYYPCNIELSRYQTAYEIFLKRDPQGAEIYGTIISNETE
jgi:hypothetical protein